MLITNGCSSSTFFKAFVTYVALSSCLVGNDFECPAEMLRFALSFHSREEKKITVDYHLHGQTGRLLVWTNGKQKSRLVNFVPELRLPFARISYICRNTAATVWNWFWRNGTRIFVWNIPTGKTGPSFQSTCLPEIVLRNDPKSLVPVTSRPNFPETFCKW